MNSIPKDFEEWKYCIQQKCGITLTRTFAEERLDVYQNKNLPETQRFIANYGEEHYERIKLWFSQILNG